MNINKKYILGIIVIALTFIMLLSTTVNAEIKKGRNDSYNLGSGATVTLANDEFRYKNVFCAQHGKDFINGKTYSVSNEYTVEDPVLAYILSREPYDGVDMNKDTNAVHANHWANPTQIALWCYLYFNDDTTDAKRILKGIESEKVEKDGNKKLYDDNVDEGYRIYQDALKETKDKKPSIKIESLSFNNECATVSVNGSFDSYDMQFFVNGELKKTLTGKSSSTQTQTGLGSGTLKVKVTAYKRINKVTYKILKNKNSQRLLVVTSNSGKINGLSVEKEKSTESKKDISVQKFVVATGSTFSNNTLSNTTYGYNCDRKMRMATSNSESNVFGAKCTKGINTYKTNTASDEYKKTDPVYITQGDYVAYKVEIYNNENITRNNITIKDRIIEDGKLIGVYESVNIDNNVRQPIFSSRVNTEDFTVSGDEGTWKRFKWVCNTLSAGGLKTYWVVVRYNTFRTGIISNKAYVNDDNETDYLKEDYDYVKMETDVSIQKFVVAAGSTFSNNTLSNTSYGYNCNRVLRMAKSTGNNKIYSTSNSAYSSNEGNIASDNYKINSPVEIKNNDYVVYKVELYNNKNVKSTVTVKDNIGSGDVALVGIYAGINNNNYFNYNTKLTESTDDELTIGEYIYNSNKDKDGNEMKCYEWKAEVDGLSWKTYWVVVKYQNCAYNTVINNKVYITNSYNKSEYNTIDYDYVILHNYAVSLEKFVSEVTDKDGNNKIDYADRTGTSEEDAKNTYRFNETANGQKNVFDQNTFLKNSTAKESANLHFTKYDNPVSVETGDMVTFTIRLRNTGKSPIKVTQIYDSFKNIEDTAHNQAGIKLVYQSIEGNGNDANISRYGDDVNNGNKKLDRYLIEFTNASTISAGGYVDVKIKFKVEVPTDKTTSEWYLQNKAGIVKITDENGNEVTDSDGTDNNFDMDWVKTKTYAVSLEKYVSKINDTSITGREGYPVYDKVGEYNNRNWNQTKYNNIPTVSNGDKITYTIKITNNGTTNVTITNIADYFPNGVKYNDKEYKGSVYCTKFGDNSGEVSDNIRKFTPNFTLAPNESQKLTVEVTVIEPNISNNILRNVAMITNLKNRNDCEVADTTPTDNKDSDFIQLDYENDESIISGKVWNDKALDKTSTNYNGQKDDAESFLSGIKVMLYRYDKGIVATTTTDETGLYDFKNSDLDSSLPANEKYIKGPKTSNTNRWTGEYYSYYVIFEYDGITYTSTTYTAFGTDEDTALKSNAREKLNNNESYDGQVLQSRTDYNNRYNTINSNGSYNSEGKHNKVLMYKTNNESGKIPNSLLDFENTYKSTEDAYISNGQSSEDAYNSMIYTLFMRSSTIKITLSNNTNLENNLKHIDFGLRGKDIFDLELTSDVYSTKVTVNGVEGTYNYNSNKVTVRRNDLNNYSYREDFANTYAQESKYEGESYEQNVRTSDIENSAYGNTGLGIQVTYKLTVKNASNTKGAATKITNFYDSKYTFVKAYAGKTELTTTNGTSGNGYKSIIITTPSTWLNQSDTMDIYVVYNLNNAVETLKNVSDRLATYNMAEITEYKTTCAEGQTEQTRGLLDKDSAPGSANKEQVRLTTTEGQNTATTAGNPTTVQYYFGGNDLSKLKYEDDTYATPTLYFVKDANNRTINGTVFEDKTSTDATTRIKTGNGIMDSGEVGVYGATVQLIEQVDGGKVRYTTTTGNDGKFEFSGFLPGNYIIKYYYGDTEKTVYLNQSSEGINGKSYNGEDFQATNNTGTYGAEKLNNTVNYWYIDNEGKGVSTATDDTARRKTVSENVTSFTDEQMTVLNNIRGGTTGVTTISDIIGKTQMWADTKTMRFELEKGKTTSNNYAEYKITNMNFGIAEVPVTTVDLSKSISKFTITDSTGQNVIASFEAGKTKGNVMTADLAGGDYWVQIEDEKLQGAKLEITYNITLKMETEKNFDNTSPTVPTVTGIVDFIDNNLSYNSALGENSRYWEVTTYEDILTTLQKMEYKEGVTPNGTIDPSGNKYTTIVKAKKENPLLLSTTGEATAQITLEKVLSSTNSTIEEIITSTVESFEYSNIVEIIGFNYENTTPGEGGTSTNEMRDRVRTLERYIILPGVQHDSATSENLVITPPTGDSSISITYYIIAVISLAVLAVGVFSIKKYVISSKN